MLIFLLNNVSAVRFDIVYFLPLLFDPARLCVP